MILAMNIFKKLVLVFRAADTISRIRSINGCSVVENLPALLQQMTIRDGVEAKPLGRKGTLRFMFPGRFL
jgi:hypothetical protein